MCLPLIVPLVTAAVSAVGMVAQARAQSQAMQAQAKVAEYQAQTEAKLGEIEQQRIGRNIAQTIGQGRAAYAANGVMLGAGGSPLDWELDTAARGAEDIEMSKFNTQARMWGYRSNASMATSAARNTMTAGYIGAGSSLLASTAELGGRNSWNFSKMGSWR